MAIVTDLNYALENRLLQKLDLMIDRCTREKPVRDAWLINEGGEGEGKTNSSVAEAYYVKFKTQREIHLEFKLKQLIDLAKVRKRLILIWDEPAFDSLKADANTKINKDLSRLLQTCRMNQHFLIINMTRFYRFNESIVVDRCLGLVHMYSRNEIEPGRFVYIKRRNLESLYRAWNAKHIKEYKSNSSFRGVFPEVMDNHFHKMGIWINGKPNCTLEDYNEFKSKAIATIGEEERVITKKESKAENENKTLKLKLGLLVLKLQREKQIPILDVARWIDIPDTTLHKWGKRPQNEVFV